MAKSPAVRAITDQTKKAKQMAIEDLLPPDLRTRLASVPTIEREALVQKILRGVANDPLARRFIEQTEQFKLAERLWKDLIVWVGDVLSRRSKPRGLNVIKVGWFLSELAYCPAPTLIWYVKRGLSNLGIERVKGRRGRRPGGKTTEAYVLNVTAIETVVHRLGWWEWKRNMMKKLRRNWRLLTQRELERKGWDREEIDYFISAKTPRAFAIYVTVRELNAPSYDAVARALQRTTKSAKN